MKKFNISPQNKMSNKELKKFDLKKTKNNPIFSIEQGVKMPLFMYIANHRYKNTETMNFMAAIMYDCKNKTIQLKGRIRFNGSGRKTVFSDPNIKPFTAKNLEELKESCRKINKMPFTEQINQPKELEFAIDEPYENIIQKINDSDMFNIGVAPFKK